MGPGWRSETGKLFCKHRSACPSHPSPFCPPAKAFFTVTHSEVICFVLSLCFHCGRQGRGFSDAVLLWSASRCWGRGLRRSDDSLSSCARYFKSLYFGLLPLFNFIAFTCAVISLGVLWAVKCPEWNIGHGGTTQLMGRRQPVVRGEGLATPGGNREPFAPGPTLITPLQCARI